jgi:hypothetical protein
MFETQNAAYSTATELIKPSRTVMVVNGSRNTSQSRATAQFRLVWLHRWYRYSALRVFLSEIRSLPHRIGYIRKISAVERLQGPAEVRAWMDGILDSGFQTDRRAGIRYMQHLSSRYPFLSIFDRLLLQEAWNAGWVSSVHADILHSQVNTTRT